MSLRASQPWAIGLGAAVGAAYAVLLSWAITTNEYNAWGSLLMLPILIALNLIGIRAATAGQPDRWLSGLMVIAFAAKMLGALTRYVVAYAVYDRASDAERYNVFASHNYEAWRAGHMDLSLSFGTGTQNMEQFTTLLYTVIGPSPIVGFAVYASLAFWGVYLLYRAFALAVPEGDHRRYAVLIFFLPSMLYWPSSMGKEAWLLLFIGVTALGAAKWFARAPWALVLLAIGAVGTAIIRPHMTVLLFCGLLVAQLLRPTRSRGTEVISKLAGLAVMITAAVVFARVSAEMLGIEDLNFAAVSDGIDMAAGRTTQGGSEFDAPGLTSPLGWLASVVTILFRPFPWESGNLQMLIQSLEGVLMMVLVFKSRSRLRHLGRTLKSSPYVAFALTYVAAFIVAFSGFSNFGILARQRVLMLPLFLVLLALPKPEPEASEPAARAALGGRRAKSGALR